MEIMNNCKTEIIRFSNRNDFSVLVYPDFNMYEFETIAHYDHIETAKHAAAIIENHRGRISDYSRKYIETDTDCVYSVLDILLNMPPDIAAEYDHMPPLEIMTALSCNTGGTLQAV